MERKEQITKRRIPFGYFWLAAVLLVVDQVTKYWAQHVLQPKGIIPVIDGVFSFTYVQNNGAAFGLLAGQKWLLLLLACGILIAGVWLLYRQTVTNPCFLCAGAAVFAGAVGNLIDRFRLSYVIDFLEVRFISFPVFNIADCCVVLGVLVLAICIFRGKTI